MRCVISAQAREALCLADDVHADSFAPRRKQLLRDRAGFAVADLALVDPGHRKHAGARARKEGLVGVVKVVGLQLLFDDRNVELLGQVEYGCSRYSLQDATLKLKIHG